MSERTKFQITCSSCTEFLRNLLNLDLNQWPSDSCPHPRHNLPNRDLHPSDQTICPCLIAYSQPVAVKKDEITKTTNVPFCQCIPELPRPIIFEFFIQRGDAQHRGSILASQPAAPGLNHGSAGIFSLYSLVYKKYWDQIQQVLSKVFHSLQRRPELSTTKKFLFKEMAADRYRSKLPSPTNTSY